MEHTRFATLIMEVKGSRIALLIKRIVPGSPERNMIESLYTIARGLSGLSEPPCQRQRL